MKEVLLSTFKAGFQIASLVLTLAILLSVSIDASTAQEVPDATAADAQSAELGGGVTLKSLQKKYEQRGREEWEPQIQKLEQRNALEECSENSLLFFGSSSFRLWKSMSSDMLPHSVINRGYGGAKYVDMVLFADRMLKPHQYSALMLFAANDVKGESADSSPAEVECALREIIRVSQSHCPNSPIFILEVTPTEKRFHSWHKTRQINAVIREVALSTKNCWCITTAEQFLTSDNQPRPEFFIEDKLHLNQRGYLRWAKLIKNSLEEFMPKKVSR